MEAEAFVVCHKEFTETIEYTIIVSTIDMAHALSEPSEHKTHLDLYLVMYK